MGYRRKILEAKRISRNKKKYIDKDVQYSSVRSQCLRKMGYPTEKAVLFKISQIADEGRHSLRYYQCPYCHLFHISHKALPGQQFVS